MKICTFANKNDHTIHVISTIYQLGSSTANREPLQQQPGTFEGCSCQLFAEDQIAQLPTKGSSVLFVKFICIHQYGHEAHCRQRFGSLRTFLRNVCAAYINDGHIYCLYKNATINNIVVSLWDAPVHSFNVKGGHNQIQRINRWSLGRLHSELTRFQRILVPIQSPDPPACSPIFCRYMGVYPLAVVGCTQCIMTLHYNIVLT